MASVQLLEPDLSGFAPVNILVDGRSLRETTGNIKDFIDKAAPGRIWPFSIDVPDNLLEGVDQIWVPILCAYNLVICSSLTSASSGLRLLLSDH